MSPLSLRDLLHKIVDKLDFSSESVRDAMHELVDAATTTNVAPEPVHNVETSVTPTPFTQ